MKMALALSKILTGIVGIDMVGNWVEGDRIMYKIEVDTFLGETFARARSRIGIMLDLPLHLGKVESIELLTKGPLRVVKAWQVVVSIPQRL